jgi:multidrug efflux pump subunit AcrA (membrane-fusion protein)
MPALDHWFTKEIAREERAVYLEDALLSGRFAGYARYRLRYFLGRCAVDAILHVLEFVFLAVIFQQHKLVSALLVGVLSHFLSAWWWGALESLRGQIREIHRDGKTHLVGKILSGWLRFALLCATGTLAITFGWVVLDSMRVSRTFDVFHCYVLAVGLRFSLSLFCQTFHSAIYAIRRIYRPFLAVVGVDLLGFIGTLLAWPILSVWSFPVVLIFTGLLSNTLTLVYVRRAYRFLGLPAVSLRAVCCLRTRFSRIVTLDFFRAGFAHALTKLDNVLVLSLFAGAFQNKEGYRLFIFFYLISPFLQSTYTWAQLFYFDLKRLELDLFVYFKQQFTRCVRWVALVMGMLFGVIACVFGTLLSQRNLGIMYGLLLLFFVVRSRLAFYQVRAFSEGRYGLSVLTGLAMMAAVWLGRSLVSTGTERFAVFVVVLLTAFLSLGACSLWGLRGVRGGTMLSLPDWLRRLRLLQRPVRLRVASLSSGADEWLVHQIARKILRNVRASGEMARIGNRRIAWYESDQNASALRDVTIVRHGGGLIEGIQSSPYVASGQKAISLAQQTNLLEGVLDQGSLEDDASEPSSLGIEQLKKRFNARFPGAVLYDAAQRARAPLESLSRRDCRQLMSGAMQYSKNLYRRVRKGHFDVTTLCEGGRIRLIFGIPQSQPPSAREAWKSFISKINIINAISPNTQPREEMFMSPTQLKRTSVWVIGLATPVLLLASIQMEERVTGSFLLKTAEQTKVYAPVAGFVKSLACRQGEHLAAGSTVAWLEIPDLASRLAQKRAELKEAEAVHRLLLSGTRPEELAEQRARLERAQAWRDKSQQELKTALEGDKQQVASKVEESRHELEFARESYGRSQKLYEAKVLSIEALERAEKEFQIRQAQIEQAIAEEGARQGSIALRAQSESMEREKELAEARSSLKLMEAGTRPEVLEAKRAELERLGAELAYLEVLEKGQAILCPIDGVIATPDLETKTGAFLREGDLFCELAAPSRLTVEISLPEQEAARVQVGQRIEMKARSLPYQTFHAMVDRLAPIVEGNDAERHIRVFCRLHDPDPALRPGMSGFARVYVGRRAAGSVLLDRLTRFIRVEFWW